MKRRISRKWLGFFLMLLVLAGVSAWTVSQQSRQEQLNHALITAIRKNNTKAALSLLAEGADPNARDFPPDRRSVWQKLRDLLRNKHDPAREKAPTALLVLLEPFPIGYGPYHGYGPDYLGQRIPPVLDENDVLVKALLKAGAKVNVRDAHGDTPLLLAARASQHPVIILLLEHGADVNVQDEIGYSPLRLVAEDGDAVAEKGMLDRGAQVDAKDVIGRTPLFGALNFQQSRVVRLLLDRGADVHTRDKGGDTPLHCAVEDEVVDYDIIKRLLEKGAEVNARNANGDTPLHIASDRENSDAIKRLLARGADVHVKDYAGKTPLKMAQDNQDTESIRLLKQAGAKE